MDYKEKVIALLNSQELPKVLKEKLEEIFPELKESKDENIRKAIMACCSDHGHKYQYTGITAQDMLYWLEKQGEQNTLNADKVIEWLKHCNITNCDMRTSIIPDSSPTSIPNRVRWFSEDFIDKFKKDFGL